MRRTWVYTEILIKKFARHRFAIHLFAGNAKFIIAVIFGARFHFKFAIGQHVANFQFANIKFFIAVNQMFQFIVIVAMHINGRIFLFVANFRVKFNAMVNFIAAHLQDIWVVSSLSHLAR
ncbi:hypothetical protein DZD41_07630 [Campylobacter hepaticus]|nr:hypothetical protein DZD41_07630 [Campylobacter hepaticus]